ncbi:MAG: hypothetical protein R2697_21270 [Ilumatobacteraceae bacterium]
MPRTAAALAAVSGGTAAEPAADPGSSTDTSTNTGLVGLKIGSRGDAVKQLQQALIDLGFTVVGGADGVRHSPPTR